MPKMTILLTEGDYARLVELAEKDKRHPQDEALVLLRSGLFGDEVAAKIADLQLRLNTMTSKHALWVDATDDLRQRVAALEADYITRQGDGR